MSLICVVHCTEILCSTSIIIFVKMTQCQSIGVWPVWLFGHYFILIPFHFVQTLVFGPTFVTNFVNSLCISLVRQLFLFLFVVVKPSIRRVHTSYTYIKMAIKAVSIFPCYRVQSFCKSWPTVSVSPSFPWLCINYFYSFSFHIMMSII